MLLLLLCCYYYCSDVIAIVMMLLLLLCCYCYCCDVIVTVMMLLLCCFCYCFDDVVTVVIYGGGGGSGSSSIHMLNNSKGNEMEGNEMYLEKYVSCILPFIRTHTHSFTAIIFIRISDNMLWVAKQNSGHSVRDVSSLNTVLKICTGVDKTAYHSA